MDEAHDDGDDDQGGDGWRRTVGRATVHEVDPVAVRAAASGDVDAFEDIVRAFQAPIWRFLRDMVGDAQLAEDLTQETFLRAYTRLAGFRFQSRFSTWLFQVARNVAVDALRAQTRRSRLQLRVVPPDDEPGPEMGNELRAALQSLPAGMREALLLVEVVGLTCAEAGHVLGVPEGTVKSRLFHARRQLVIWFRSDAEATGEL